MAYALSTNKKIAPLLSNMGNWNAWMKNADREMTKALSPYRDKIKGLKDELNKQHESIRDNNLYSLYKNNRWVSNLSRIEKEYSKLDQLKKQISKEEKRMEYTKQKVQKSRDNWKKLLKKTEA